jgi:formylglycine-generating enzyme required for sulfatase activity/DNA-binding winged helix-turn-helix (wHTH) protein
MTTRPNYRFDRFVLNLERGCLQTGERDVELRPKSFAVLLQLVENAGRLMSKDELVAAVWPNIVVSDDSLAHCIRDVRKVLDDSSERFIKTVPRRGYMFVADVASQAGTQRREKPDADALQLADLEEFERDYRERLRVRFAEEAEYFVPLSGETREVEAPGLVDSRRSAGRRRHRASSEYREWLQSVEEIKQVTLGSLREAVERYPTIILLGDPGCGKTSSLENLAYEFSTDDFWLPILVNLGDLGSGDTFDKFIVRNWMSPVGAAANEESSAILRQYLEAGKLILLFDALNEMPLERYREQCLALRHFIDRWSPAGNRFVVSCRVLDYGKELSGLQRIEIQPLSDENIRRFIEKELPDDWHSLWGALTKSGKESVSLLEMARNPYILTVMIDVFGTDGQLIQNRSELMQRFVGILMGWAGAKSVVEQKINSDVTDAALSLMAFEMQRRSGFGTPARTDDVKAILPREMEVTPGWPAQPCDADQVLSLASSAHIIEMPVDRKTVRFYHQLLQEFFAAQQMIRLDHASLAPLWRWPWLEDEMPAWNRPSNNFDPLPPPPPTGWEETTILAAGLPHADAGRLLGALSEANPVLAARCVSEGHAEIDPEDRQRLVGRLLSLVGNPAVALRSRIAAGEALGRLGDPRIGEMVAIPAGKFAMGEGSAQHEVWLPDYEIGTYPVTNTEFARFVDAGGYRDASLWTEAGWREVGEERDEPLFWHNARFNKPNQPVIGLSWYECVAYCRWLSAKAGRIHRLPSEAEWEKAARGSEGRTYPWGDLFEANRLNAREGDQKVYCSTPVGVYPGGMSPFGLFDCAGNAWEWCATRWKKPFPYNASEDEWAAIYLEGGSLRALRGGSWNYEADVAECAYRFRFEPYGWSDRAGFRIVCPESR